MLDTHARKQLLLTRIAAERQELTADLRQFRHAASLPSMLRSAIGPGFIADLLGKKSTRGQAPAAGSGHWLATVMSLMQRYRVAATLIGSVLPMFRRGASGGARRGERGGRGIRRLMLAAVLGGAAFTGWKFSRPGAGGKLGA